jgi:hypothetical protein
MRFLRNMRFLLFYRQMGKIIAYKRKKKTFCPSNFVIRNKYLSLIIFIYFYSMKKTILAFLLPICMCSGAWAQKVGNPNQFAQTITEEDLTRHLKVIAADSMEGRDTGSEGMRKAGRYIAAHFKNLGLLPPVGKGDNKSYMQEYMLAKRAWQATTTLSVGKNTYKFGTDFYALRFPSASPFELKAEVVIVPNDGIESLEKMNVKGKAVVFLEEKVETNKRIASRVKELGAVAVIVVKSLNQEKFKEALQTNAYYYSGRQPSLVGKKDEAIYYISPAVATELLGTEKLEKALKQVGKPAKTTITIKGEYSEKIEFKADNILGFLEGTDKKDEVLVITTTTWVCKEVSYTMAQMMMVRVLFLSWKLQKPSQMRQIRAYAHAVASCS